MRQLSTKQFAFSFQAKWLSIIALVFVSFIAVDAQNTKGDKPASNNRSVFRIPKLKTKKKGGDKAYTGDISGRRIRTKNKSSAVRAIQTAPPRYANRKPSGDRPYKAPLGSGNRVRIKSKTAEVSRDNVYPNNYVFQYNPSSKPKDNQHAYSNRKVLSYAPGPKRQPPGRKRIISPRSASRSFVTRGRKNVYWGKFRKGERPITTDISGRTLRAKNFHTPGLGVLPANEVYKRKKKSGDQPFKGTFSNGYVTTPKGTRPWRGDLSGHAIRSRAPKVSEQVGKFFDPRVLSISNKRRGLSRPLPGSGLAKHPYSAKISNRPIQGKAPGIGANLINRSLSKFRGRRPLTNGNHSVLRGFNNKGQPIGVKGPGIGGRFVDIYQGTFKAQRPIKGGGSISGRSRNNGGSPITVKGPGIGGRFVDIYQGTFKAHRPLKGGGSISGRSRNNGGSPITVKGPGIGGRFVDTYQGTIKGGVKTFNTDGSNYQGDIKFHRPLKGGGSISGRSRNNGGVPINVKGPGVGSRFVDTYQGTFKAHRPLKGGGSISGRSRNNGGRPVIVKGPGIGGRFIDTYQGTIKGGVKTFNTDGSNYQGDIKFHRPPKGGGSVSGKLWNNSNKPILVKAPAGAQAKYIDIYQGLNKAHKPIKGGGSVSGKLWNNNEKPIEGKAYLPSSRVVGSYRGDRKQSSYVRNPNAKEEAIKKLRPGKSTYLVGDLQIKTKARQYERNKLSSKNALKGESNGKNSLKAIEYSTRVKQLWVRTFGNEQDLAGRILQKKYMHNPHSKKGALIVMAPGRSYARIKDLQVNVKMMKPHGNNLHPDSKFAHSLRDNVKHERTFLMTLKLKWAKLFKKNDTQPAAVKQKIRRPRYDPKERDLWKDLYD